MTVSMTRNLFQQGHGNINKTWGLIVLLVSKMAGYQPGTPESEIDDASGLLKNQRTLAEAVETTSSANGIHRDGILNMQHMQYAGLSKKVQIDNKPKKDIMCFMILQTWIPIVNSFLETR